MSKKPSADWPPSKDEIGSPCIDQPRNAAELRQWIAERYVTLEMIAMASDRHTDGRIVHQAWDWAEWLELRGYPPRPEDPPNGWTPHTERIALDELRHWLDAYAAPSESTADGTPDKAKDDDDLTGEERALALLVAHPEWTDAHIAEKAGVSRTTLYKPNWTRYQAAREALKQGRGSLPRGTKDGETGDVEAWDDDSG